MTKINISIESCIRYFEDNKKRNDFLTFQVKLPLNVSREKGLFSVKTRTNGKEENIFSQKFQVFENHITFFNSHEDPVVKDNKFIYLSLHIPTEIIKQDFDVMSISISGLSSYDFEQEFNNFSNYLNQPLQSFIDIDSATIFSKKDTILTLHLGDISGKYTEETFLLGKNDFFCFDKYIEKYSYIGVQCSYENKSPEIEEKHIIKGQKGIYETGILRNEDGDIISQGLLPFNHRFLNQYYSNPHSNFGFIEVNSINEILEYHKKNPIQYFESSLNFLEPEYRKQNTYSQAKLFKSGIIKKSSHLDLKVCQGCLMSHICVQVIPSGLSHELMRKNISLTDSYSCLIHQLIIKK